MEFDMPEFYASRGTLHHLSYVETPQQSAIVERKHQHILNVDRALKLQANLSLSFWGHCTCTAVILKNRLPSPSLHNRSSNELLFHKTPSYSYLEYLGPCALFQPYLHRELNLSLELGSVCFLVILTALKVIESRILIPIPFLYLEM